LNTQISSYEPANRQTTPDFLVAVTDPNARLSRPGFSNQPRTAVEFAEYFRKSPQGRANSAEVDEYLSRFVGNHDEKTVYIESARAEFAKGSGQAKWVFVLPFSQFRMVNDEY
jgi:ATP-binding cassette subfamily G (WHITE) protein 2 (SNQ2)